MVRTENVRVYVAPLTSAERNFGWLIFVLMMAIPFLANLFTKEVVSVRDFYWSWKSSAYHLLNGLKYGLVLGLVVGVVSELKLGKSIQVVGFGLGFLFGILAVVKSFNFLKDYIPAWSNIIISICSIFFVPFFFAVLLALLGRLVEFLSSQISGLGEGVFSGILLGLSLGLICSCLLGWQQGGDIDSVSPNQGTKISLHYFFAFFVTLVLLAGALMTLVWYQAIQVQVISKISFLGFLGIFLGLIFGTVYGMKEGMTTFVQHSFLRLILYRLGYIPWNYAQFLNYASERLLLQRVGGRYRFMHKLLQEHFAAMLLQKRP